MTQSETLFAAAQEVIPGGVNSPVRAFASVGGTPPFIARAQGPWLFDVDGNRYIDYVGSWGPMILGHAHPRVVNEVREQALAGLSYGAPCALEVRLARLICRLVPSIERVRMVNSGTEAAMTAVRLARAHTGREGVIKFAGGYHGHVDALLVAAGSGSLTLGLPGSPGIPAGVTAKTLTANYNDLASVAAAFAAQPGDIACVMVEPVAGNMNCIPPESGFLEGLRSLCDEHGAVLIFDEVMTGFRVAAGGAQARFGIKPDLTILGKIVGGGLPVGAVGGAAALMEQLAPTGNVYQAGTLSGNPLAMAAGAATLETLIEENPYPQLEQSTAALCSGLESAARNAGVAVTTQQVGAMFGLFFTSATTVRDLDQAKACDTDVFRRFFHAMLARGIYLAPSAFEAGFVSTAHGSDEIEQTLTAARAAFATLGG